MQEFMETRGERGLSDCIHSLTVQTTQDYLP